MQFHHLIKQGPFMYADADNARQKVKLLQQLLSYLYGRFFVKPTLDTRLRLNCNYSVFLQFKHSVINLNFVSSLLVCMLFYSPVLSTVIYASEILHMLLQRLFNRLSTYIHVAEVFESGAECGRACDVTRRCAATAVVRSTVRNSALTRDTRDLQSRELHWSLCNKAAMSGVRARLGPQNSYFVYYSRFRGRCEGTGFRSDY
jgi:hypothetical protein